MTISIAQQTYRELLQEVPVFDELDSRDEFDGTWKYPEELGQGYSRWIELRDGLVITIESYQPRDRLIFKAPDRIHPVECTFHLAGGHQDRATIICAKQYALYGSGLAPATEADSLTDQPIAWLSIHVAPDLFRQWLGSCVEDTLQPVQELLRPPDQPYYTQVGNITATMEMTLQQMLHCPYEGSIKRLYLESKAWELMTLSLNQMIGVPSHHAPSFRLKPDDIDCIHHARDILLQQFDNPPTLPELARQAQINECSLKRGFRQVFGTTVFNYLHDYRLDYSRQLLEQGHMTVTSVAQAIGFASRSSFARAFRQKFGMNPGQYLKHYRGCKNSG
jgi:AraC-like DNA-binding protein